MGVAAIREDAEQKGKGNAFLGITTPSFFMWSEKLRLGWSINTVCLCLTCWDMAHGQFEFMWVSITLTLIGVVLMLLGLKDAFNGDEEE